MADTTQQPEIDRNTSKYQEYLKVALHGALRTMENRVDFVIDRAFQIADAIYLRLQAQGQSVSAEAAQSNNGPALPAPSQVPPHDDPANPAPVETHDDGNKPSEDTKPKDDAPAKPVEPTAPQAPAPTLPSHDQVTPHEDPANPAPLPDGQKPSDPKPIVADNAPAPAAKSPEPMTDAKPASAQQDVQGQDALDRPLSDLLPK